MVKIRKTIDLWGRSAQGTTSTTYTPTDGQYGIIRFPKAHYDNISAIYFEASFNFSWSSGTQVTQEGCVRLYNKTTSSAVSGSEVCSNPMHDTPPPTGYFRLRSGDIKAELADDDEIYVQYKADTGFSTTLYGARLIIIQDGDIKNTVTFIKIGTYNPNFSTTSYTEDSEPERHEHDTTAYDGTVSYEFHVTMKCNSSFMTAYAELWDQDNSAQRAQVSTYSTTYTTVIASASTVKSAEHTVRTKVSIARRVGAITLMHLVVFQSSASSLTKTVDSLQLTTSWARTGTNTTYSTTVYKQGNYDPSEWDDCTLTLKQESSIKTQNAGATAYAAVLDDSSTASGSEVSTSSTSYTRLKSGSITEPATNSQLTSTYKTSTVLYQWYSLSQRFLVYVTNMLGSSISTRTLMGVGL